VAGTESARAPQLYTVLEQRKTAVGQVRGVYGCRVLFLGGRFGLLEGGEGGVGGLAGCCGSGGWWQSCSFDSLQRCVCGAAQCKQAASHENSNQRHPIHGHPTNHQPPPSTATHQTLQGLMGTEHVYVLPGQEEGGDKAPRVGDKRRCAWGCVGLTDARRVAADPGRSLENSKGETLLHPVKLMCVPPRCHSKKPTPEPLDQPPPKPIQTNPIQTHTKSSRAGAAGVGDVEVTLLPEELEGLDEAAVKALYEEKAAELRVGGWLCGVFGGGVGWVVLEG